LKNRLLPRRAATFIQKNDRYRAATAKAVATRQR
jgi:hypothetical protein